MPGQRDVVEVEFRLPSEGTYEIYKILADNK